MLAICKRFIQSLHFPSFVYLADYPELDAQVPAPISRYFRRIRERQLQNEPARNEQGTLAYVYLP